MFNRIIKKPIWNMLQKLGKHRDDSVSSKLPGCPFASLLKKGEMSWEFPQQFESSRPRCSVKNMLCKISQNLFVNSQHGVLTLVYLEA